jgi:hypothetical protein
VPLSLSAYIAKRNKKRQSDIFQKSFSICWDIIFSSLSNNNKT